MSMVDKNALELCLQIGGERLGKTVFPFFRFDLPKISYNKRIFPNFAKHDVFTLLTDGVQHDLNIVDPYRYKKCAIQRASK